MLTDRIYRLLRPIPLAQRQLSRVVRRLPHRNRVISHFGRRLIIDPSELSGFYLYYEREYDDPIFRWLVDQLPNYVRAIDIGANIGVYTTFLAKRCNSVDAFEPEPCVLRKLKENLALNCLQNVTTHEMCVAHVTGTVQFTLPTSANEGVGHIAEDGVPVPCTTLDDFLANSQPEPIIFKMDIEGGEWLAVPGMRKTVQRWDAPLAVLMELHPEAILELGGTMKELHERLEEIGLKVYSIDSGKLTPVSETARFWWMTNDR